MSKEYDSVTLNGDVPKYLKLLMLFIDRVGFPVLAFCLMFWLSFSALNDNTKALNAFSKESQVFSAGVTAEHKFMCETLIRIENKRR